MLLYSKWANETVVIEPKKTGRIDGETTQGKAIRFYNHYAEISDKDEKLIEDIKNTPAFGVDYWIVESRAPQQRHITEPTVNMMPGEKEAVAKAAAQKSDSAMLHEILGLAKSTNEKVEKLEGRMSAVEHEVFPDGVGSSEVGQKTADSKPAERKDPLAAARAAKAAKKAAAEVKQQDANPGAVGNEPPAQNG